MKNSKQISKYLLFTGGGLASISAIALMLISSAAQQGAFSAISSVSDCQISFLKGGKGCDTTSPAFSVELWTQAGLAVGLVLLVAAAIVRFRRPEETPLASEKGTKTKHSKGGEDPSGFAQKLRDLQALRKEGLLTNEEFEAQKKKLLG